MNGLCPCGNPARPGQRNCLACNAAAQKRYRLRLKAREQATRRALQKSRPA